LKASSSQLSTNPSQLIFNETQSTVVTGELAINKYRFIIPASCINYNKQQITFNKS
jgi:hypothetical protein